MYWGYLNIIKFMGMYLESINGRNVDRDVHENRTPDFRISRRMAAREVVQGFLEAEQIRLDADADIQEVLNAIDKE